MKTQGWCLARLAAFALALVGCGSDAHEYPCLRVHPDAPRVTWEPPTCTDLVPDEAGTWSTTLCAPQQPISRRCLLAASASSTSFDSIRATANGIALIGRSILTTADDGHTWSRYPAPESPRLASVMFVGDAPHIALDASGAIQRFVESGWTPVDVPPGGPINALSCVPTGERCIAAGDDGRVVLSIDSGQSWHDAAPVANAGDAQFVAIDLDETTWGIITSNGHIYTLRDRPISAGPPSELEAAYGGRSWQPLPSLPPETEILSFAISDGGARALVGTQNGLLYAHDTDIVDGQSWDDPVLDAGQLANGMIWELGDDGSLGMSVDDGQSWNVFLHAQERGVAMLGTTAAFHFDPTSNVIDAYIGSPIAARVRHLTLQPTNALPLATRARWTAVSDEEVVVDVMLDENPHHTPVELALYQTLAASRRRDPIDPLSQPPPPSEAPAPIHFNPQSIRLSPGETVQLFVDIRRGDIVERLSLGTTPIPFDPSPHARALVAWLNQSALGIIALLGIVGSILLVYLFRPIWIASLHHRADRFVSMISATNETAGTAFRIVGTLLIDTLATTPRVLDAWIRHHRTPWRERVEEVLRKVDAGRYHPLPVDVDGQTRPLNLDEALACLKTLASPPPAVIAVIGPGGLGKTSWVGQLCRQLAAGDDWLDHRTLPLFIADEAEDGIAASVQLSIRELLGSEVACSERFAAALLRRGRVTIVWDRLSECSAETRRKLVDFRRLERPPLLIVTARDEQDLGPGAHVQVRPRPVAPEALAGLVQHELGGRDGSNSFRGAARAGALTTKVAELVEKIEPTALLVKMFVQIAWDDASADGTLSEAEVFARYARRFSDEAEKSEEMFGKLRALADECVTKDGFPSGLSRARADVLCGNGTIEKWRIAGLLVARSSLGSQEVRFALDPIAEHLAARARAERAGATFLGWEGLLKELASTATGFRSALRAVHRALRATHPESWPDIDWTKH